MMNIWISKAEVSFYGQRELAETSKTDQQKLGRERESECAKNAGIFDHLFYDFENTFIIKWNPVILHKKSWSEQHPRHKKSDRAMSILPY